MIHKSHPHTTAVCEYSKKRSFEHIPFQKNVHFKHTISHYSKDDLISTSVQAISAEERISLYLMQPKLPTNRSLVKVTRIKLFTVFPLTHRADSGICYPKLTYYDAQARNCECISVTHANTQA